jgi:hypothetical protein
MILVLAAWLQACSDEATDTKSTGSTDTAPAKPLTQDSIPGSQYEQAPKLTTPFDSTGGSTASTGAIQQNAPHGEDVMNSNSAQESAAQFEQSPATDTSTSYEAPVMQVQGAVGNLTWTPAQTTNQYDNIQVKVSGPEGVAINKTFGAGESAMITDSLPDGYYKWETVTTPSIPPHIKEQMREVRNSGDINAERKLMKQLQSQGYMPTPEQAKNNVQSGGFRVIDGQVLDSSEAER